MLIATDFHYSKLRVWQRIQISQVVQSKTDSRLGRSISERLSQVKRVSDKRAVLVQTFQLRVWGFLQRHI
jgi:hypothetical protein